jgi:hypothetical protein
MVPKRTKIQILNVKTLHKKANDLATPIQITTQGVATHVVPAICFVADSLFLVYFYLFTHTGFQHDFNITCYSFSLPVIWKVPLVEQEEPGLTPCVVIIVFSAEFVCSTVIKLIYKLIAW